MMEATAAGPFAYPEPDLARLGRPETSAKCRPLSSSLRTAASSPSMRGKALLLRGSAGTWDRIARMAQEMARSLDAKGIVWVCFQHPASKVRSLFGNEWNGRLDFVDTVSRSAGLTGEEPGVSYCESPGAIHTVLASLHPLLKEGPRVVVWDSLNAALPCTTGDTLLRSMTVLNARAHKANSTVVYYLVEGSTGGELSKSLEGAVDQVLEDREPPTWRQVMSLEKPLLYGTMAAMAIINAGLTMVLLKFVLP